MCTDGELASVPFHPVHSPKWERRTDGIYYIQNVVKFTYELSIGLGDVWGNGDRFPSILNLGIGQRRLTVLSPAKYLSARKVEYMNGTGAGLENVEKRRISGSLGNKTPNLQFPAHRLIIISILCLTRDFIRQGHAREKRQVYRATRTRSQAIDRG